MNQNLGFDLDLAISALGSVSQESSDFDLNDDAHAHTVQSLREASVLVLVTVQGAIPYLTLTKRSKELRHHPGQIALPGGKRDTEDKSAIATALREANEEIGLPESAVELIGVLPNHRTVTGFDVSPIVVKQAAPFDVVCDEREVSEVFSVPLSHVLDVRNYSIEGRVWNGRKRLYYSVPYGPYYIWGATARILKGWAEGMLVR